jgi:cell division protein FtsW (lipid II flippase)
MIPEVSTTYSTIQNEINDILKTKGYTWLAIIPPSIPRRSNAANRWMSLTPHFRFYPVT